MCIRDSFHKKFTRVLNLAQRRKNIMMYGPTGSGKSHLGEMVATALDLPFYSISCTAGMSEGQVTGRLLPVKDNGAFDYVPAEFVKAYEEGGVFLLDEMDAADPNVLLIINSALANKRMPIVNRPENPVAFMHEDFVMMAGCNTVGTGADRMYSGRAQLDASTLDRFNIGKVLVEYDHELETQLITDRTLRETCWTIRKNILDNRLERAMSLRFMLDSMEMMEDWTINECLEGFFQGWRSDEVAKAVRGVNTDYLPEGILI